jgi:hypothetical protein
MAQMDRKIENEKDPRHREKARGIFRPEAFRRRIQDRPVRHESAKMKNPKENETQMTHWRRGEEQIATLSSQATRAG